MGPASSVKESMSEQETALLREDAGKLIGSRREI